LSYFDLQYLRHFKPEEDQITMYHTHFNSIHSTQLYLRDNLIELKTHSSDVLISASEQTMGVGRKGSQWDSYTNSLAMSFTLRPNFVPTLTPIEIGILATDFLKKEFGINIFLKWPNDLMTSEVKKCGGIIAQYIDTETIIGGFGLNLGNIPKVEVPDHYKHGLGNVSDSIKLTLEDQKNIPANFFNYILKNRINEVSSMQARFKDACIHIGKKVIVDDDGTFHEGVFIGIGKNGEALIEILGSIQPVLASSLKILN
jgi:BirA family biotin operon repressor/biotin-[acetyl-CoA-carboxylase] ligase